MLKPSLQLKLGQQLTMTPQLHLSIRLLQLQRRFEHRELRGGGGSVPDSFCNQLKDKMFCSKSRAASKPERLTQVHLTDLGVGKDFFRSAGGNYRPLVDDIRPRAYPERLTDIMVSDQYADAALGELADDALNVQDR